MRSFLQSQGEGGMSGQKMMRQGRRNVLAADYLEQGKDADEIDHGDSEAVSDLNCIACCVKPAQR